MDGIGRNGCVIGHICVAMSMLAERFGAQERSWWVYD
jgi:hypothetical protein